MCDTILCLYKALSECKTVVVVQNKSLPLPSRAAIPATNSGLLNAPLAIQPIVLPGLPTVSINDAYCHNRMTIACTIVRRFECDDFNLFNRPACPDGWFNSIAWSKQTEFMPVEFFLIYVTASPAMTLESYDYPWSLSFHLTCVNRSTGRPGSPRKSSSHYFCVRQQFFRNSPFLRY